MSKKILALISIILFAIYPISKCVFSVPDLSETSYKINTYTIDFRGIDTPPATYWSLANYHLDLTDFQKTHSDVTGGGAYGGLQTLSNGERVSILSFWKINYKENGETKTLLFNRVYPPGEEMNFSGEGEGTTYRAPYNWKTNVWYRFVIHTWEDNFTSKTFIGQWIQDLSTKEWTLFSYFNTNLSNSYIGGKDGYGGLLFFQEIFNKSYLKNDRSFQLKNMYVFDREKKEWISINKSYLYYNENPELNKGINYTPFYFYGFSMPKIDDENEEENQNHFTGSISQPKTPDFDKPVFTKFDVNLNSTTLEINWEMDSTTCPTYKYSYTIEELTDSGYKTKTSYAVTRPEGKRITMYSGNTLYKGTYRISFTAHAISNDFIKKQVVKTI